MDQNLQDAETKVVTYLDAHAKIARGAAWVAAGVNALRGAFAIATLNVPDAIICAATAVIIVWLLVKTRVVVA